MSLYTYEDKVFYDSEPESPKPKRRKTSNEEKLKMEGKTFYPENDGVFIDSPSPKSITVYIWEIFKNFTVVKN